MSSLDAPLRGLTAAIRRVDAPDRLRDSVRAFMAESGVTGPDLEAMQAIEAERWLVYRRLVFNRFLEIVEIGLPRTCARIGRERVRLDVARFVEQSASRSPYLRDVVGEFVAWAQDAWAADESAHAWWIELARHEVLAFEVSSLPKQDTRRVVEELSLDAPVCWQDAARLARYEWAVHELTDDQDAPVRRPTSILAYRDEDHQVRFLSLEPVGAAIVDRLMRSMPLGEAIRAGCLAQGVEPDDNVLAGTAELLADLAGRGILRGTIEDRR